MKQLLAAGGAVALMLFAAPASAQDMGAKPEGHAMTITGTVVDISCKFSFGLTGDGHRMCAQVCADQGVPLAILGSDGKLYIPTSTAMPGGDQNGRLKEFAEQSVRVSGTVYEAGGARAIQIESVRRS
ncbi:MAG TPA: hypothetical protein VGA37_04425 [Gemmatimonadales bacterium]